MGAERLHAMIRFTVSVVSPRDIAAIAIANMFWTRLLCDFAM